MDSSSDCPLHGDEGQEAFKALPLPPRLLWKPGLCWVMGRQAASGFLAPLPCSSGAPSAGTRCPTAFPGLPWGGHRAPGPQVQKKPEWGRQCPCSSPLRLESYIRDHAVPEVLASVPCNTKGLVDFDFFQGGTCRPSLFESLSWDSTQIWLQSRFIRSLECSSWPLAQRMDTDNQADVLPPPLLVLGAYVWLCV